jgi:hypothetical protein
MVPCLSELERDSSGGYCGGFETKNVTAESDQANPGFDEHVTLGRGHTTLGADDDEIGARTPDQGPLAIQVRQPTDATGMTDEQFRERMREVNDRGPGSV